MKIIILTSRFGMGHYCAAEAIRGELLESNSDDTIEIVDIIEVFFPIIYKLVYWFFNRYICRFSSVYNFVNRFAMKHENACLKRRSLNKINSLIEKNNPDLIVSTWSACSRYVSIYKEEYRKDIQLYTYVTDITVHDGWITNNTDKYFVAAKSTMESLVNKGVDAKKIIVNGIPVRKEFKNELQLKPIKENINILIMGGGLGLITNLDNILEELYETDGVHITIITGKNRKLLKKLKKDYPKINAVGYTNQVHKYMEGSDLLITKPGGISTFEAIYTTTPLYIIKPSLSQEVGNAKFIEKMFIGKIAWENDTNISDDIISIIFNERLMKQMKYNMKVLKNEISEFKLMEIYKRDVKQNVANRIDNHNDSVFNDIWSNPYINLQDMELEAEKA